MAEKWYPDSSFSYAEYCAEPSWIDYFARESVLYAGNLTHEIGICSGDSGGPPLTYFNGTHNILVGVTSFTWSEVCEGVGQLDGFAKVSHVMDWIRKFGDDYVNSCSAWSAPEIIENPA